MQLTHTTYRRIMVIDSHENEMHSIKLFGIREKYLYLYVSLICTWFKLKLIYFYYWSQCCQLSVVVHRPLNSTFFIVSHQTGIDYLLMNIIYYTIESATKNSSFSSEWVRVCLKHCCTDSQRSHFYHFARNNAQFFSKQKFISLENHCLAFSECITI